MKSILTKIKDQMDGFYYILTQLEKETVWEIRADKTKITVGEGQVKPETEWEADYTGSARRVQ